MIHVRERRISIAATNRLGRRIRHDGLTTTDHAQLELVLLDAFDRLNLVAEILRKEIPDVAFTPRLKTIGTIVDKLDRERTMALSKMGDIAGIRCVEEMNRVEQDVLVRRIGEAVGGAEVNDRRTRPSFGYRAVHLEVNCDGLFVEIQVRTGLQDQWAQIVERLGDSWGRQVRYGGDPPDPSSEIIAGFPRSELWNLVKKVSEQVDLVESYEVELAMESTDADDERLTVVATSRRDLAELMKRMERVVVSGRV